MIKAVAEDSLTCVVVAVGSAVAAAGPRPDTRVVGVGVVVVTGRVDRPGVAAAAVAAAVPARRRDDRYDDGDQGDAKHQADGGDADRGAAQLTRRNRIGIRATARDNCKQRSVVIMFRWSGGQDRLFDQKVGAPCDFNLKKNSWNKLYILRPVVKLRSRGVVTRFKLSF